MPLLLRPGMLVRPYIEDCSVPASVFGAFSAGFEFAGDLCRRTSGMLKSREDGCSPCSHPRTLPRRKVAACSMLQHMSVFAKYAKFLERSRPCLPRYAHVSCSDCAGVRDFGEAACADPRSWAPSGSSFRFPGRSSMKLEVDLHARSRTSRELITDFGTLFRCAPEVFLRALRRFGRHLCIEPEVHTFVMCSLARSLRSGVLHLCRLKDSQCYVALLELRPRPWIRSSDVAVWA